MAPNRGPALLGVNITFAIIAIVTVALRCYTRIWIVRSFGVDDWLMVVATIFFMGYIISSNLGVSRGTGQHKSDLSTEDYEAAMRDWWFCYLFFSMTMVVSKLSFAWFLLRIVTKRIHAWVIYGAAMCTVIAGGAFFFVTLFQCNPISHYWDKTGQGHCIDMKIIVALGYLYSVFSMVTDFTFAILPAFVVWQLNLQKRARVSLIVLIAMGCMASTAVVVRFAYLKTFLDPDFLWATLDLAIWSTVEMGLGITAASLSTLRPLIKAIGWKFGLTSQRSQQYGLSGRPSQANEQHKSNPLSHVYIRSEVSQNASRHDSKRGWDLGTKVTAYAGDGKMDDADAASTESCERLARTTTTNSTSLAEEGKVIPQYYLQ